MQLTLSSIKENPAIDRFISETDKKLNALNYTDHGRRHANIVADRAQMIAGKVGLSEEEVEYAGIAGFCHDMGNFLDRVQHHYWASLLFYQTFHGETDDIEGLTAIMQAIANHDKSVARLTNNISAALIIADKSDVHRDRVKVKVRKSVENGGKEDIHNRVNYAIKRNDLDVNEDTKVITLMLKLDQKFTPVMDYFEIFLKRMKYCRQSAEYLGYRFRLVINDFELL